MSAHLSSEARANHSLFRRTRDRLAPRRGRSIRSEDRRRRRQLLLESLEARHLLAAVPHVALDFDSDTPGNQSSANVLLGESMQFQVKFENQGTEPGFGPFIDLVFPTRGTDGNFPVGTTFPPSHVDDPDGISFVPDAVLTNTIPNTTVTSHIVQIPGSGTVQHPFAVDEIGTPAMVTGRPGDTLVVLELPFGSFAPSEPELEILVTADVSNLADVNVMQDIQARAGFWLGLDAENNAGLPDDDNPIWSGPAEADETDVSSDWSTVGKVTPSLFTITKVNDAHEGEIAAGPNFPVEYTIKVDIATGQTIEDLIVKDEISPSMVYRGGLVTTPAATTTNEPTPFTVLTFSNNLLDVTYDSITGIPGNDITIRYSTFVNRTNGDTNMDVVDEDTGDERSLFNTATVEGAWKYPIDTRDQLKAGGGNLIPTPIDPVESAPNLLVAKSLAIQKCVVADSGECVLTPPGTAIETAKLPGSMLEYRLTFQVSDYFAFNNLVITDTISDGQRIDTNFIPELTIHEHGLSWSSPFIKANAKITDNFTGGFPTPSSPDGTQQIEFFVSNELADRGANDDISNPELGNSKLLGGCVQDTGGLDADCIAPPFPPLFGKTEGTIVFRTIIQEDFDDDFPSGDSSVDQGDRLDNEVVAAADLCVVADLTPSPINATEEDNSATTVVLKRGELKKTIYAINGSLVAPNETGPLEVAPGDDVTFRFEYDVPGTDFENLQFEDYLPLPFFDPTLSGPTTQIPLAGDWAYGPTDTLSLVTGPPSLSFPNGTNNSVRFSYGTFDNSDSTPRQIDILLTVKVDNKPHADRFFITNLVHQSEGSTNTPGASQNAISQLIITQPVLNITKGVIAADNQKQEYSPPLDTPPGFFTSPGTASCRFSLGVGSNDLPDFIDRDLEGVDAGDSVTFAIVVENTGSGLNGAFDVRIRDTLPLPPGLSNPSNLTVTDGNCIPLTVDGGNAPTFAALNAGMTLDDPGPTATPAGALDPYDPTSGNNLVIITYDAVVDNNVQLGDMMINTATLVNYAGVEGGPDHTDPTDQNDPTDDAKITIGPGELKKSIVATSEPSTVGNHVTIGEIIRYRAQIQIPEGKAPNFSVRDTLPAGLQFLNDGTATIAFVSNGAGISSSKPLLSGSDGDGDAISLTGNENNLHLPATRPLFDFPQSEISPTSFSSGVDPVFWLGDITNDDRDDDCEYIVLEFNVLVNNTLDTNDWDSKPNRFVVETGDPGTGITTLTSNNAPIVIVEPKVTIDKEVVEITGSSVTYQVTITNTEAHASAFDVQIFDSPTPPGSVSFVHPLQIDTTGTVDNLVVHTFNSGALDLWIDEMGPLASVELTYSAEFTICDGIHNYAEVLWTSLPGTNGTPPGPMNLTGSQTPGAPGSTTGERTDFDFPNEPNDYLAFDEEWLGSISGHVWHDVDGNGVKNGDEQFKPWVKVDLIWPGPDGLFNTSDDITLSQMTDANGFYQFCGLPAGNYTVRVDPSSLDPRKVPAFDPDGGDDASTQVVLTHHNLVATDVDFGFAVPGSIHGFKFEDVNFNGRYDLGEPPLPNVEIELNGIDNRGNQVSPIKVTTDANGEYWFTNLMPGTYTIDENVTGMKPTAELPITIDLVSKQKYVAGLPPHLNTDDGLTPTIAGGVLSIQTVGPAPVVITTDGNDILINGGAHTIFGAALSVVAIEIEGSPNDDLIDLSGVTRAAFPNLTSVDIDAGAGDDVILGSEVDDTIQAGDGDDDIDSGDGNDVIDAGPGDDTVCAGDGDDEVHGGDGDDRICAGAGNDLVFGDDGNDRISGDEGDDVLFGGDGDDGLAGNQGDDEVHGDAGNDIVLGDEGDDEVFGGAGDDLVFGEAGVDIVDGGPGNDLVAGGGNGILAEPGEIVIGETEDDDALAIAPWAHCFKIETIVEPQLAIGNVLFGSIHGIKFEDIDGDGERDMGEAGVVDFVFTATFVDPATGNTVTHHAVSMADDPSTTEDETGHFWFTGLMAGMEYQVREIGDALTFQVPDVTGGTAFLDGQTFSVTIGSSTTTFEFDVTNVAPGVASGHDTVEILDASSIDEVADAVVAAIAASGLGIVPEHLGDGLILIGDATVVTADTSSTDVTQSTLGPSGFWRQTTDNPDPLLILSGQEYVATQEQKDALIAKGIAADKIIIDPSLHFGNEPGGSVHGRKWLDLNGDGKWNNGEQGLAGVKVFADLNNNGRLDDDDICTVTMHDDPDTPEDETGLYWMDLPPGAHTIYEVVPDGYRLTFPHAPLARPAQYALTSDSAGAINVHLLERYTINTLTNATFTLNPVVPLFADPAVAPALTTFRNGDFLAVWRDPATGTPDAYTLFCHKPDGTFREIPLGDWPEDWSARDVADLNQDGREDILLVRRVGSGSSADWDYAVALRQPDGSFDFSQANTPIRIVNNMQETYYALGDIDGDWLVDIVYHGIPHGGSAATNVMLLQGNGDGTFEPVADASTIIHRPAGVGVRGLVLGDYDKDGDVDVFLVPDDDVTDPGQSHMAFNDGGGIFNTVVESIDFAPNTKTPSGTVFVSAATYDVGGDGDLDMFGRVTQGSTVDFDLYFGKGDGTFETTRMTLASYTTANQPRIQWLPPTLPGHVGVQAFYTDFDQGVPGEFTGWTASESVQGYAGVGNGTNQFAGDFLRNDTGGDTNNPGATPQTRTTLTLTDLPPHTSIDLNFLLAVIDSWDNDTTTSGEDFFHVTVDGVTVFRENFANVQATQGYAAPNPAVPLTGTHPFTDLGWNPARGDSAYDLGLDPRLDAIPHSGDTLVIEFFADGAFQGGNDESWAIDNVEVLLNGTRRHVVHVEPGGTIEGIDFGNAYGGIGNFFLGAIHGFKFHDVDEDGAYDPQVDRPMPWIEITLTIDEDKDGNPDSTQTVLTDANGEYWFTDLGPGWYTVEETDPGGGVHTTLDPPVLNMLSGRVFVAELGLGGALDQYEQEIVQPYLAIGNAFEPGAIHGCKFIDTDGDGHHDPGELPLPGVEFELYIQDVNGDFQLLDTVTTLSTGIFWFTDLRPGVYRLREVNTGALITTVIPDIDLGPGQEVVFGDCPHPGSIHGLVYHDADGNGVFNQVPDQPLAGATVKLQPAGGGASVTLTTGPDGEYDFDDLPPGTYTLIETPPTGYFANANPTRQVVVASGQERVAVAGQATLLPGQFETVDGADLMFGHRRPPMGHRVIDDGDPGFTSTSGFGLFGGQGHLNDVRAAASGPISEMATWTFTGLVPGDVYDVATTWTAFANRTTSAPFTISGVTVPSTVNVNQQIAPNDFSSLGTMWETLGTFTVDASGTLVVELSGWPSGTAIADAVCLQPRTDAEIEIRRGSTNVVSGASSVSLGAAMPGAPSASTFSVVSSGAAPLLLQPLVVPAGFVLVGPNFSPGQTLAPGGSATFQLALDAFSLGTKSGNVTLANSDSDENPFTFQVTGEVLPPVLVRDDGYATGYSDSGNLQLWTGQGFQSDVREAALGGAAQSATWTFTGLAPGTYRVSATWTPFSNRATNANYLINGANPVAVNQKLAPNNPLAVPSGTFVPHGGFNFADLDSAFTLAGNTLTVSVSDAGANGNVIADAVRIERLGPLTSAVLVETPAGTEGRLEAPPALLDTGDVATALAHAVDFWSARFPSAATRLHDVQVIVQDLPSPLLGLGSFTTPTIWLDADADGHGWRLADNGPSSSNAIDLEHVVTHELGHILGLTDSELEETLDLLAQDQAAPAPVD